MSERALVNSLPGSYSKYGLTTAGEIRSLGGTVFNDVAGSSHVNISGLTGNQLESLFTPVNLTRDLFK